MPFLALILSSSILAALYSTLSTPFYSISSSVNGTKNGSSLCIFQVSNLSWAFTVPFELSCKLKQNLCDFNLNKKVPKLQASRPWWWKNSIFNGDLQKWQLPSSLKVHCTHFRRIIDQFEARSNTLVRQALESHLKRLKHKCLSLLTWFDRPRVQRNQWNFCFLHFRFI